jgi:autophagy-related protein 2
MHSFVQLFQGVKNLFYLPVEQYQKDGRLAKGLQRGVSAFSTSAAMAVLKLTNRMVQALQGAAEFTYDMVSPGPSVQQQRRQSSAKKKRPQPSDIREGVTNAYNVVKEGLGDTAHTIVRVASKENEQKGVPGAVGGVLRQIPPTLIVKPIILVAEATSNVLEGFRSQLEPEFKREAEEKWKE